MSEKKPVVIVGTIDDLIEKSSFGTPGAVAVRRRADPSMIAKILIRAGEPGAAQSALDEAAAGTASDDDAMRAATAAAAWLSDIERDLTGFERRVMSEDDAYAWWLRSRKAWGRLQQVRKGTRVCCPICSGRDGGRHGACHFCLDGFLTRDEAIDHYEMEMEFACK